MHVDADVAEISETASAPEVNPGLLDSFFYKDLEATDATAFPSSPAVLPAE